jgi:hypothetical protein
VRLNRRIELTVTENTELDSLLASLREQGRVTLCDVARIKASAGRLSVHDATAIRALLEQVMIGDGSRDDLEDYLWREMEAREAWVRSAQRRSDIFSLGCLAATAVALPLTYRLFPSIAGYREQTSAGMDALQIAVMVGESLFGAAASSAVKAHYREKVAAYCRPHGECSEGCGSVSDGKPGST